MKKIIALFLLITSISAFADSTVALDPIRTQYGIQTPGSIIGGNFSGSPYTNTGTANTPTKWLSTNNVPNEPAPNGSFATTTAGRMFIRTNGAWVAINAGSGGGSGISTLNGNGTNTAFWQGSLGNEHKVYDIFSGFIYSFTAADTISIDTDGRKLRDSSGEVSADWGGRTLKNDVGVTVLDWNIGSSVLTEDTGVFVRKVASIDATASGVTTIFTVIPNRIFVLTSAQVFVTELTGVASAPVWKIQCDGGDMTAGVTMTGTTQGHYANALPLTLTATGAVEANNVQLNITTAATGVGITYTVTAIVSGYYISP